MREIFIEILFWSCAAVLAYIYVGYPVLLFFLSRRTRRIPVDPKFLPRVTLVISAFNEERVIGEKLANSLALDYPRDLLDILVVSDCSDDGTDDIVRMFAARGVRLVRQPERLGKSAGLNLGVPLAAGDILIFSDANALYRPDAVRHLVKHFLVPDVGYVVGNARYVEHIGLHPSAQSEGLYWKLETWLKERESDFGSVVGGDGAIYAIRRELFKPLRPTDINDLLNPLQIIALGYAGRYERAAICYEEAGDSFSKEFRRKVRIISRSLNALRRAPQVLLPWTQPRHWLALVSHKLLRWIAPIFLLALFLFNVLLTNLLFYRFIAIAQIVFYVAAAAGWMLGRHKTVSKVFSLPYYFCLMNLAASFGLVKFLQGSLSATWQTVRQDGVLTQDSSGRVTDREA